MSVSVWLNILKAKVKPNIIMTEHSLSVTEVSLLFDTNYVHSLIPYPNNLNFKHLPIGLDSLNYKNKTNVSSHCSSDFGCKKGP